MPAIFIKGAIVVVSVVGAAAIAVSQIPEVRALAQDCRRKIAVALRELSDEINPNHPQQPRFNRPEDAEGFMQPHAAGGEMDADEESRRRQREELMYWNAIKMENLEKQKAKENKNKGPTFDDILRKNSASEEETAAIKSGAEIQEDEGTLRRRGEGSRGMDRGSAYANPFADENYLDSDGDARMIAPEEDEVEDIYTDNDLRNFKEPVPESRVLAAASDYPLGEHYTMQLENPSTGMLQSQKDHFNRSDFSAIRQDYLLGLEQENRERANQHELPHATPDVLQERLELSSNPSSSVEGPSHTGFYHGASPSVEQPIPISGYPQAFSPQLPFEPQNQTFNNSSYNAPDSVINHGSENKRMRDHTHQLAAHQMQLQLLDQQQKKRKLLPCEDSVSLSYQESEASSSTKSENNAALQDRQMHLMLLEQQNKRRLMIARLEQERMNGVEQDVERTFQTFQTQERVPFQSQGNHALQDYQMQLMLLEQQNKKRLMIARHVQEQEQKVDDSSKISAETRNHPATSTQESEHLVDVSEPSNLHHTESAPDTTTLPSTAYHSPELEPRSDSSAFASIHAWADNSNTSFYSPLPGTPKALSVASSEPEHLGGDITPTDSISLAGSGEDIGNDNASSVGGGRYDDVISVDGDGISTPGSWTEVGSVVSEDDLSHR